MNIAIILVVAYFAYNHCNMGPHDMGPYPPRSVSARSVPRFYMGTCSSLAHIRTSTLARPLIGTAI